MDFISLSHACNACNTQYAEDTKSKLSKYDGHSNQQKHKISLSVKKTSLASCMSDLFGEDSAQSLVLPDYFLTLFSRMFSQCVSLSIVAV